MWKPLRRRMRGERSSPVICRMIHRKKISTRMGMMQEVTIITASASMKRLRMFEALAASVSAVSDSFSSAPARPPGRYSASASSEFLSENSSAEAMVVLMESSYVR